MNRTTASPYKMIWTSDVACCNAEIEPFSIFALQHAYTCLPVVTCCKQKIVNQGYSGLCMVQMLIQYTPDLLSFMTSYMQDCASLIFPR